MEDFFRDFFGRIEYCVPVRTIHFQTDRRKNQLVVMVQRACVCMPARRLGVGRTRRSASVDSGVPVSIRSAGWFGRRKPHPRSARIDRVVRFSIIIFRPRALLSRPMEGTGSVADDTRRVTPLRPTRAERSAVPSRTVVTRTARISAALSRAASTAVRQLSMQP